MSAERRSPKAGIVVAAIAGLIVGAVLVASLMAKGDGDDSTACSAAPGDDSTEYVYRLRARLEPVTAETRNETMAIMCKRLRRLGIANVDVSALAGDRIRLVVAGDDAETRRVVDQVTSSAQLHFYDWEPNLIGREREIGGFPGRQPAPAVLEAANDEWAEAGRRTGGLEASQLIFSGAFPTAWGAVRLAERQAVDTDCEGCSTDRPRFYLFSADEEHRLIAGPELVREDLFAGATGEERARKGIVATVPPGTVVVYERPLDPQGRVVEGIESAGWYALKDNPALSGADITDPKQEADELGRPNVTFAFTDRGREAFQEVTRAIAQRGQASAIGPVDGSIAEQSSGHFAVVLDNEVKTRPIINFAENPDGIDGRVGAQISGGFSSMREAQSLAVLLRAAPLPLHLVLIDVATGARSG